MINEGANIWFAKNKSGKIVTVDKIDDSNKHEEYMCPICTSKIIPKAIKEDAKMIRHFAHKDASKCDRETQIHFFVKNELLKQGDKFTIKLDNEIKQFVCKEILIEEEYKTEFGTYKPDITVITEDDKIIYFEVAHTNKKKIEDYLDIWMDLNNIVVEVKTKEMIEGNILNEFNALFYEGKCFNVKQEDKEYYDLIGKIKLSKNKYPEKQVRYLGFLWKDISKYLSGEIEMSELSDLIQSIENEDLKEIVVNVLRKNKCTKIMEDYIEYNTNKSINILKEELKYFEFLTDKCRLVYDRVYYGYKLILYYEDEVVFNREIYYETKNIIETFSNCKIKYAMLNEYIKQNYEKYYSEYKEERGYQYISIKNNQKEFDISLNYKNYTECIREVNEVIKGNEDKIVKLNNFSQKVEDIKDTILSKYKNIQNIYESTDNKDIYFNYKYGGNLIKDYQMKTNYSCDIYYYLEEIDNIIKNGFNIVICELFTIYYPELHCFTKNKLIYIDYLNNPIGIEPEFIDDIDKKYINSIITKYHSKIEMYKDYENILKDYYYKCNNTKNNYYITLLDSSLDIYYKGKIIESINYFKINDINYVLNNNMNLKLAVIEDIDDYNKFEIFNKVIHKINIRYSNKVDDYWRVRYDPLDYEELELYNNDVFIDCINTPNHFVDEHDLFKKLINKISARIRKHLHG